AVLALAALCAGAYSGARMARTYLLKPLLDQVLPAAIGGEQAGAPDLGWPGLARVVDVGVPAIFGAAGAAAVPADALAERFWALLLAGLLVALVIPLAHFGSDYANEWALGRVLVDIQQQMAAKLLSLPLGIHHELRRGDALSRTLNDALRAHGTLRVLFADVGEAAILL